MWSLVMGEHYLLGILLKNKIKFELSMFKIVCEVQVKDCC
jgi:hypothetical protein